MIGSSEKLSSADCQLLALFPRMGISRDSRAQLNRVPLIVS
ncbi:hypothetical protein [Vibrio parahaemolyticus]|nr:hypothetical protein [Vibrio parahaemolyticus]MCS0034989.1 hypothetical protein [Vibrio parahaemolyticus]WOZ58723.1 hypothetical protein RHS38_12940 [Vibrio parahaemolyticus]